MFPKEFKNWKYKMQVGTTINLCDQRPADSREAKWRWNVAPKGIIIIIIVLLLLVIECYRKRRVLFIQEDSENVIAYRPAGKGGPQVLRGIKLN